MSAPGLPAGLTLPAGIPAGGENILTADACTFVAELAREFGPKVARLLDDRQEQQQRFNAGEKPDFLRETEEIRQSDWQVAEIPQDLLERRVEITGPTDRKMVINALNSGANVFMADFEDALAPTWANLIDGQRNLVDANAGSISWQAPDGREYSLGEKPATLFVRPRGWHLYDRHVLVDGQRIPGALIDFGLYLYHNHAQRAARGLGVYFYLPKLENHREAALWREVFDFSTRRLGLAAGTIRVTVLIEVILAVFELHEILYELRPYIVGCNCGRWDYIFSYIKKFQRDPNVLLPNRIDVTMTVPFMRAYSRLVIQSCHRRGAFAMGGMAAQLPVKGDEAANDQAFAKVRADKEREVGDGHDGTWVSHPAMVATALEAFSKMPGPNQLGVQPDFDIGAAELLQPCGGEATEAGMRNNIGVGLRYLGSWLSGQGAVPINNLMEDAATAEIARSQLWQWRRWGSLSDARFEELYRDELKKLERELGDAYLTPPWERARELYHDLCRGDDFIEFLTLPAYEYLP